MKQTKSIHQPWAAITAVSLAVLCGNAWSQERESLEALRQTTRNLIDALVETGVLTREKADALIESARQRAAVAEPTNKPNVTPEGKPVIRVPYVPESMRAQIRNEVKEEVLAQARAERWGIPNAAASWTDRIKIEGDIRYRHQVDSPSGSNTLPQTYLDAELLNNNGLTRSPDFASFATTPTRSTYPTASTTDERTRERLRLRLGVSAKVTDEVGVGLRLATGSATDRVSTNQTLGQNFNKYQVFVDRAFVRLDPAEWVTLQGGRIPNPWFSTEMAWNDNLNFEGLAATFRYATADQSVTPFFTVGYFPLREDTPPSRDSRSLIGAQLGTGWQLSSRTRLKFGAALYEYRNLEGHSDTDYRTATILNSATNTTEKVIISGNRYGRHEYGAGLRQRGNTLFETNPLSEGVDTSPVWGLAYKFRPLVLTASAEFTHFSPFNVLASLEYARNLAFSEGDFRKRATDAAYRNNLSLKPGGSNEGYNLKLAIGALDVRDTGDWQVALTYRSVGSDAVLDAFTDSDLGLGGTNLRGYSLGMTYGLYRNTTFGVRYLAARNLDTTLNSANPDATFKVNTLQVDLNVRF